LPIADLIRERGPVTVAAFMDLALNHPHLGYYARSARRSGRQGDFFTSVDVGPIFGELLEVQLAEMAEILRVVPELPGSRLQAPGSFPGPQAPGFGASGLGDFLSASRSGPAPEARSPKPDFFDIVDAGASDGRLAADILSAAHRHHPWLYERIQLHLVETSAAARTAQPATLAGLSDRLVFAGASLPDSFEGVIVANELLDALPVHQVVMTADGLRETYVIADDAGGRNGLGVELGPLSTPALAEYLSALGVRLERGWRAEINLQALDWIRNVARRIRRGFVILIDYGHDAGVLYSASHATGTLTTFASHRSAGPEWNARTPPWLEDAGERDITAHVDFTSVCAAAEHAGLDTLAILDQTYFLLGLLQARAPTDLDETTRRALKTLIVPGGLGSTHKVLILGKGVGKPQLTGCSFRVRMT
jgi:SAM-dependent MidA family methyltransferase